MAQVSDIAVALIDDPAIALRLEIDDYQLDELCGSIRDIGLQMPLIVKATGDRWEVVDGHRRLLAVRRLGFQFVPCRIHEAALAPDEAVKLACNLQREDNTDAEIAAWLGELATTHGYNIEQLCQLVKRSESWVNDHVALLRGYDFVFDALASRKINYSQAKAINRCRAEDWARMGLHYAVCDNLPAARLTEYFVRNCPDVSPPTQASVNTAPPEPVAGQDIQLIECAICGGNRDPQNLITVMMHRWHWEQVLKIAKMQAE